MQNTIKSALVLFAVTMFSFINAQNITGKSTKVSVDGTSPMHEWTMTASAAPSAGR